MSNMDWMNKETVLRRAKRGDTYHRAECPRAKSTIPWLWAEGRHRHELEEAKANGLHACKVCDPDSALPIYEWWETSSDATKTLTPTGDTGTP